MTTRINTDGPTANLTVSASAHRVTPPPSRPFSSLLNSGTNAVIEGAEAAAQRLPGGPALVAAVREGQAAPPGALYASGQGYSSQGLYGASGSTGDPVASATGTSSTAGSGHIESALARQTQDNLYYLGLQQRIQDETRHFQAVSNVLKTQHDSVKNAIGNLR